MTRPGRYLARMAVFLIAVLGFFAGGLIASWRYFHRWVALLMVALVVIHIVTALQYGSMFGGSN